MPAVNVALLAHSRTLGRAGRLGVFYSRLEPFVSEPVGQVPLFPSGAVRLAVVVVAQSWLGKE